MKTLYESNGVVVSDFVDDNLHHHLLSARGKLDSPGYGVCYNSRTDSLEPATWVNDIDRVVFDYEDGTPPFVVWDRERGWDAARSAPERFHVEVGILRLRHRYDCRRRFA